MIGLPAPPAQAIFNVHAARLVFLLIHFVGLSFFAYIIAKRVAPLMRGERDRRFDRPLLRLKRVLQFWLGQWKHPRFRTAGVLHILFFAGFIVLVIRTFFMMTVGIPDHFVPPGYSGESGHLYNVITDYAVTLVFLCMIIAAIRRVVFKPPRYGVPARFGEARSVDPDAIFLLALIATLMFADSLFEAAMGAGLARQSQAVESFAVLSLPWALKGWLASASLPALWKCQLGAYLGHEATFYFLLCYRPFGIQFHVETSLFNVYFAKLDREALKPVRWDTSAGPIDQAAAFGVKAFEDFTWKHMLDFYSCADCGRCADQCPANAVGRPLSPRFMTIKARNYAFQHFPVFGGFRQGQSLVGSIYSEDEIWSCTTCGACEAECPLLVEHIDKVVDLRRGLIDEGRVPQSLQRPLKALESRGNPYGKPERKRADWAKATGGLQNGKIKVLSENGGGAKTLYFVDSATSYDDRLQAIGRATASILTHVGEDFGIAGSREKDSGHEVRRFGEEALFSELRDHNMEAITASGAQRIVTSDAHAFNALKHDYQGLPPVEHISQFVARKLRAGSIAFNPLDGKNDVYTYHDPCYLGRHNQVYDEPREVLDAIPGLKRVEMARCRDRSFCCGGGGLMLFYEPKEEQRMGVVRVNMAQAAGANVIVTACPFCMVNIEDAIKVAGLEGKMSAIDLAELVDRQISRNGSQAPVAAVQ